MKKRLLRSYAIGILAVAPFLPFAYPGVRNFGDVLIDTAYVVGLPVSAPVAAPYGRGEVVPPAAPPLVAFSEAGAVALISFLILSARGRR